MTTGREIEALITEKSEQYIAERKAHEATRAELTRLRAERDEAVAREAIMRTTLKTLLAYLGPWIEDYENTEAPAKAWRAARSALDTPSPRAQAMLAVVEAARALAKKLEEI